MDKEVNKNEEYEVKQRPGDQREYRRDNYLQNGSKTQNQFANSSFKTTIEEPALNKSGEVAKKNGY